jgi:hypothetical protein
VREMVSRLTGGTTTASGSPTIGSLRLPATRTRRPSADFALLRVQAMLAQSLKRLNIRGCYRLHATLPALLGRGLLRLEAGWLAESTVSGEREMQAWVRVFPRNFFRQICAKCPALTVLRVPGYLLMSERTPRSQTQAIFDDYAAIARCASLKGLRRLDLCCAQLLSDAEVVEVACGCRDTSRRWCTSISAVATSPSRPCKS